jgi:DNA polymerase-4
MGVASPVRTVLHVDMDAFFVSVELLRRPELRGRPVVVGGAGPRGVVAAASYEARADGVFSAMPSARARILCPDAVFLSGDHAHYAEVSERVMSMFRNYTPLVEPLSLDEAFLDVTGVRRLHGDGPTIATTIRDRVRAEEGLVCSVGVATSKFVAKLASKAAKPEVSRQGPREGSGVAIVAPGEETAFVQRLDVRELWGVGPATEERLSRLGVTTVAALARLPVSTLIGTLGRAQGEHLHRLARAEDDRPVVPDAQPKSISHEETYPRDLHAVETLRREVVRQADAVAGRLRRHGVAGRTITLKVRFGDFRTITRSVTTDPPASTGPAVARAAKALLDQIDLSAGVRLLGVAATGLVSDTARQLTFVDSGPSEGWEDASRAVDRIRGRFGDGAIGPAATATDDGLDLVRRGAQQWGPDVPEDPRH